MYFTILPNYTPQYCKRIWISKMHLAILLNYIPEDVEKYGLVNWQSATY